MNACTRILLAALCLAASPDLDKPRNDALRESHEMATRVLSADNKTSGEATFYLESYHEGLREMLCGGLAFSKAACGKPLSKRAKENVIELLALYRLADATPQLIDELEFRGASFERRGGRLAGPLGGFPAAKAMVRIGPPAIKAIFDSFGKKRCSAARLRICAFVIYSIDGKELGLCRLELALAEEQKKAEAEKAGGFHTTARKNLSRLIRLYKSIDFTNPKEWPGVQEGLSRPTFTGNERE